MKTRKLNKTAKMQNHYLFYIPFLIYLYALLTFDTVSWATVTADVKELRAGITQMEKEIPTIPKQGDEDRFAEVMEVC
jgi:hypothetical protein